MLGSETTLASCFSNLVAVGKWGTRACLMSRVIAQCEANVKDFTTLRLWAKRRTQDLIVAKLSALLCSEIKLGLAALLNRHGSKGTLLKVCTVILSFDALCHLEALQTQIKDTIISDLVSVEHPCATKQRKKGLRLKVQLASVFTKREGPFEIGLIDDYRLMRNFNSQRKTRV